MKTGGLLIALLIQEHRMLLTTIVFCVVEGKGKTSVKCAIVNIVVVVVVV